ncbi:replication initiator [Haloactinopolyspora sp.]|uniref:replication initiator n=1 Tax=Haloactinopolyspora sp. TaxID=1966353 RepID=UPI0026241CB4|nr:replication initiator [Haloactinopolyspora sp.]
MSLRALPDDATLREVAASEGVCVRPVLQRVTDTLTGDVRTLVIPCGATLASVCPSCADRARKLRIQQCREGWHLAEDPPNPTTDEDADDRDDEDDDGQEDEQDEEPVRRVRSTRRRQDAPDLPRLPVSDRTTGRVFETSDGKTYRPSMFLTLTLPSYGRVTSEGVPVDPGSYDYRRAALDAMHFPKLIDRFWQNLRRATGYSVQYFATVEPQRRLAPHLHAAIRGAIPRALLRQVVAATYHQVWWPDITEPVYSLNRLPAWDEVNECYRDPDTGHALPTWDESLDAIDHDPDAVPAHVIRAGTQVDIQGVIAGTPQADRVIGYLTKYLTKNITDPLHTADDAEGEYVPSAARAAHIDRLAAEVKWLPCSERCANWLLYGIQPNNPRPGLEPGRCRSKAHHRDHLGLGGRRVLVSRRWTGKTLTEHRADRAAVVRAVLESAGIEMDDHDEYSATTLRPDGQPRFIWNTIRPGDTDGPSYARLIGHAIAQKHRWRTQYRHAQTRAGPDTPNLSATTTAA